MYSYKHAVLSRYECLLVVSSAHFQHDNIIYRAIRIILLSHAAKYKDNVVVHFKTDFVPRNSHLALYSIYLV